MFIFNHICDPFSLGCWVGEFVLFPTEEPDEDEDDDTSEESVEDESEEDRTEKPKTASTQPPYSLIPPPPVWVQRNQGLSMRTCFFFKSALEHDSMLSTFIQWLLAFLEINRLHRQEYTTTWIRDKKSLQVCFLAKPMTIFFQCGAGWS